MTVGLRITGKNACELQITASDSPINILESLEFAVTGKMDAGYYDGASSLAVSPLDGGYFDALYAGSFDLYNLDCGAFDAAQARQNWEVFDRTAGVDSCCYRAATKDATYKYVVLRISSSTLTLQVYESWNAVTHVGINLAWQSDATEYGQLVLSGTLLQVFSSDRWLGLLGSKGLDGNPNIPILSGCFEISRDDDLEPRGLYPRYAWLTQSSLFGLSMDYQQANVLKGQTYSCFSLPRSVVGEVGANASKYQMTGSIASHAGITNTTVDYQCYAGAGGTYRYRLPYAQTNCNYYDWIGGYCGNATANSAYNTSATAAAWRRGLEQMLPTGTNPWNTTGANNYVFSAYAVDMNPLIAHVRGRFYGLKLLANNVGATGDTIDIKIDPDGLYSKTGIAITHYVVRLSTGGCVAIPLD